MTFVCPIPRCGKRRYTGQVLCRVHWFSLPASTRNAIWSSCHAVDRNPSSEAKARHRDLCFEAARSLVADMEPEPKDEYDQAELNFTTGTCKDER